MEIVVEGVETQAEIDFLAEIGCRQIQGYYYAKPMDTDAFLQLYSGSARPVQR
jgi:EAL domain-containing protein (putative c-di-GMP-specific phosphodiesterase class I)